MRSSLFTLLLTLVSIQGAVAYESQTYPLAVHNITRSFDIHFENLAIRSNGQILATSAGPNASIYQIDPSGILPLALIYTVPNVGSTLGIVEGKHDVFYFAAGDHNFNAPFNVSSESQSVTEIDVRGLYVMRNGTLTRQPEARRVAGIPKGALLNGVAFARPTSDHILVADSFRGLVWNVNIRNGTVGVTLNDTTTRGPAPTGQNFTGINGLKVFNGSMYYTNTGSSSLFKVPVDEFGDVPAGETPSLIASGLSCDDLVLDAEGNAYVAAPEDVITKVTPDGQKQIIAGVFNSSSSPLIGPTAIRFGRRHSDRHSMYVTTNGGLNLKVPGSAGVSRIDLD